MTKLFCNQCGNKLSDNAEFCNSCGKSVEIREVKAESSGNSKKTVDQVGIFFLGIFILLILGGIAFYIFHNSKAPVSSVPIKGQSYFLKNGAYSAFFPEEPTFSTVNQEFGIGNTVSVSVYDYTKPDKSFELQASYVKGVLANQNTSPQESLKNEVSYTGNQNGFSLVSSSPTIYDGLPAIDYLTYHKDSNIYELGKDIAKGNDLYMLNYEYSPGNENKLLEDSFFNSLTFSLLTQNPPEKSAEQTEIDSLKKQVAKIQAPSEISKPTNSTPDYASIVSEWKNRIAEITCGWADANGTVSSAVQGSATLVNVTGYGLTAVTNAHVESDSNGGAPTGCTIGIYGLGARAVYYNANNNPFYHPNPSVDLAFIKISNTINPTDNGAFETYGMPHLNVCSDTDVNQGDEVMILGYPWDGSKSSVTSTRGIISGFDGSYYVTDAKIDHGNSGGAAILVKDDCYLGIPSAAVAGTIESYGRILSAKYIFGS